MKTVRLQLIKAVEIFFELHVVGSFDSSKGAALKNYSMLYSEIEKNIQQSSNNHPYLRPAILVNEFCLSAPFYSQMQT